MFAGNPGAASGGGDVIDHLGRLVFAYSRQSKTCSNMMDEVYSLSICLQICVDRGIK